MLRLTAIACVLLARAAVAEEAPAPESPRAGAIAELRGALVDKAQAPARAAELPRFGVDALRRLGASRGSAGMALPGAMRGGLQGVPRMGPQRARDAADRAAQRATGDGGDRHGERRRGDRGGRRDGGGPRDGESREAQPPAGAPPHRP